MTVATKKIMITLLSNAHMMTKLLTTSLKLITHIATILFNFLKILKILIWTIILINMNKTALDSCYNPEDKEKIFKIIPINTLHQCLQEKEFH